MTVCPNVLSGNSDITLLLFRRKIPLHVFGCVHRTGALHFLRFPRWITVTLCCRHLRLEQRLHVLRQRRNVSRPARSMSEAATADPSTLTAPTAADAAAPFDTPAVANTDDEK